MKILLLIISLAVLADTVMAQDALKTPIKVSVQMVPDTDSQTTGLTESFITRELRSLGDVTLTDQQPDYVLQVIATKVLTTTKQPFGYAMSFVLGHPYNTNGFGSFAEGPSLSNIRMVFSAATIIVDHQLLLCGPNELKKSCEGLVAALDSGEFKFHRKLQAQAEETFQASLSKRRTEQQTGTNSLPASESSH